MFDGMPVWHVSVARITSNRQSIKPVDLWVEREIREAAAIAVKALDGVGNKLHQWHERGEQAIHIRRQLSQPEIDELFTRKPDAPVFLHGKAEASAHLDRIAAERKEGL